ncbi:MAG: hypothetical protein JXQ72_12115 [Anaerolineae bacterium]|nr:hypothetical protein [Anaerolineae bacterium]
MNNHITYAQTIQRLQETNQPYGELVFDSGAKIVITQRGARVLGPFLSDEAESLFWMHPAWAGPESFKALLLNNANGWNLGGERIWIAPEIQFVVHDRANFTTTMHLPPQMDPGDYTLDQPHNGVYRARQSLSMAAYNLATGQKNLDVEILVRSLADPLRFVAGYEALVDGVTFAGYEEVVTLTEHEHNDILSESWNLVQLNPGGQLIIPVSPVTQPTDYNRGTIPDAAREVKNNYIRIDITGQDIFKIGYKAAHITGRLAYFNTLPDDHAYLLVRQFSNNPSSIYIEEPDNQVGEQGDSVHVYNDSGSSGGFGEMECQGQTIGGVTGQSSSTDRFMLWAYVGAPGRLKTIAAHLLGVML